jgi:hypothetical protein
VASRGRARTTVASVRDAVADLNELKRHGLIRRRLRGGYAPTRHGLRYLRDAILRNDELRAEMGKRIDRWEAGELTKDGRRQALVELIGRGWEWDGALQAEALASLRARGFDPLAALEKHEES